LGRTGVSALPLGGLLVGGGEGERAGCCGLKSALRGRLKGGDRAGRPTVGRWGGGYLRDWVAMAL
jgi:hypothetical protein